MKEKTPSKQLMFATSNKGKIDEAQYVLSDFGFQVQPLTVDFVEPTAGSIHEVALEKLKQVLKQGDRNVFVEDSGIFFQAYDSFPGVLSKRVFQGIGYRGIEKLLKNESNKAWFEGVIAVCWHGKVKTFSAKTTGTIVGQHDPGLIPQEGLPFDPIFIPTGENLVLRQLSLEQRMKHSYRRKALVKMMDWIEKEMS